MDQLPKEIIDEIKYFYRMTEIDIIQTSYRDFYFCINHNGVEIKLKMVGRLKFDYIRGQYYHPKNDNAINEFIADLSNNKYSRYDEDNYREGEEMFDIEVTDKSIKIWNAVSEVSLSIENKNLLIEVMKKYQHLLNTYQ